MLSGGPRIVALTLWQKPQEYVVTGALFQAFLSNIRDYVTVSTKACLPMSHFFADRLALAASPSLPPFYQGKLHHTR
ncbi:hypothetical protein SAMN04488490_3384 [Marinobacter sp. LV10R510-11A]|nr:hypothetical protein SAMN04488490_3384 [Marinobacter sp. LV10R510-11A]